MILNGINHFCNKAALCEKMPRSLFNFFFSPFRSNGFHLLNSYLGSLGNTMHDCGLLKLIQLIFPGSTTANEILNGGCFDKAICAHFLRDAAICQYVMKYVFTNEKLDQMRSFIEKACNEKMEDRYTTPIVAVFGQRFERFVKGGRTLVQYHQMVGIIKIFIRTERLADYNKCISCVVTRC